MMLPTCSTSDGDYAGQTSASRRRQSIMLYQSVARQTSIVMPGDRAASAHVRGRPVLRHVRRSHRLTVRGFRERDDGAARPKTRTAPETRLSGRSSRSAVRAVQAPSQQRSIQQQQQQQQRWQDSADTKSGPASSGAITLSAPAALRKLAWRLMGRGGRYRTASRERDSFETAARNAAEAAEQAAAVRTDPTGAAGTPIGRFGLSSARVSVPASQSEQQQAACRVQ